MKNTSLFLLQNASTLTLQHPHLASVFLAVTLSLHQIFFYISFCSAEWILPAYQPDVRREQSQAW